MARLYVLSGSELGASFEVGPGAVLGRAAECEVRLGDASISRRHARLEHEGGRWWLVDLDSRNGIRSGGERVERVVLADLDEVWLGEVQVRFREEPIRPQRPGPAAAPRSVPAPRAVTRGTPRPRSGSLGGPELEEEIDLGALAAAREAPVPAARASAVPAPRAGATDDLTRRRAALLREGGAKGGLLTDALEDRPAWLTLLLALVLLAATGGLAYGVFRLVVGARGG